MCRVIADAEETRRDLPCFKFTLTKTLKITCKPSTHYLPYHSLTNSYTFSLLPLRVGDVRNIMTLSWITPINNHVSLSLSSQFLHFLSLFIFNAERSFLHKISLNFHALTLIFISFLPFSSLFSLTRLCFSSLSLSLSNSSCFHFLSFFTKTTIRIYPFSTL